MKEPIELTPEDKKRISDKAYHTYPEGYNATVMAIGFRAGAEYATKYERERANKEIDNILDGGASMAANQCLYGIHGDDGGNSYCPEVKRLQERIKELEAGTREAQEQLSFHDYLLLIGASPQHAIAVTIWDTLEHHKYIAIIGFTIIFWVGFWAASWCYWFCVEYIPFPNL